MVIVSLSEVLLIVDLVLLVVTIYLLRTSTKEARGRSHLIDQLIQATRTFSRAEYFTEVQEAVGESTSYIYATVTGTPPKEDEHETIERLLRQFARASKAGVRLRFILPKDPGRLMMGHRYKSGGSDVMYNSSILVSDLRYMVVDGRVTVLGFPERSGAEEPTRKGYKIYSEGVSLMFKERFESLWESPSSIDYDSYLENTMKEAAANTPGISDELLASLLRLPIEEIRRGKCR
ncbi:MAG: hypothetical protein H3Z50_00515 [archaeon]|nr:hypothetical protein [archaeon]MCP8305694.1 hypothetical protein [archaeon]